MRRNCRWVRLPKGIRTAVGRRRGSLPQRSSKTSGGTVEERRDNTRRHNKQVVAQESRAYEQGPSTAETVGLLFTLYRDGVLTVLVRLFFPNTRGRNQKDGPPQGQIVAKFHCSNDSWSTKDRVGLYWFLTPAKLTGFINVLNRLPLERTNGRKSGEGTERSITGER